MSGSFPTVLPKKVWQEDQSRQYDDYLAEVLPPPPAPPAPPPALPEMGAPELPPSSGFGLGAPVGSPYPGDQGSPPPPPPSPLNASAMSAPAPANVGAGEAIGDGGYAGDRGSAPPPEPMAAGGMGAPPPSPLNASAAQQPSDSDRFGAYLKGIGYKSDAEKYGEYLGGLGLDLETPIAPKALGQGDPTATVQESPGFLAGLGGMALDAVKDYAPKTVDESRERGEQDAGNPDLPGLPWAMNGPGLFPHFQPPKPTRDLAVESKVERGESLTGDDFAQGLLKATQAQYQQTPAGAEGVPFVRLGTSEDDVGRAWARGGGGSGPSGPGGLGGTVRAAGELGGYSGALSGQSFKNWALEQMRRAQDVGDEETIRHLSEALDAHDRAAFLHPAARRETIDPADLQRRGRASLMEPSAPLGAPEGVPLDMRGGLGDAPLERSPLAGETGKSITLNASAGVAAGFGVDDEGNPTFDPYRAGAGMALGTALSRVPAVRAIEQRLANEGRSPTPLRDRVAAVRTALSRQWTDRDIDLARFQRDAARAAGRDLRPEELAYELNRLTNGSDHAAQLRVQEELIPAVKSAGRDRTKLSAYLALRDRGEQQAIADLAQEMGADRFTRLEAAAKQVDDFRTTLADRRRAAGLPDRIPRIADPAEVRDPLGDVVREAFEAERDVRKNGALQAVASLSDQLPNGPVRRVSSDYQVGETRRVLPAYDGGQRIYLAMPREMAAALENESKGGAPAGFNTAMAVFKMALTSRNPAFLAGNAVLDGLNYTGRTLSREGGNPLHIAPITADLIRAYGDAFKGVLDGTYHGDTARYLKGGGGSFGFFEPTSRGSRETLNEYLRGSIQIGSVADLKRVLVDLATFKPVETIGERIELAPRVAAMRRAEKSGQGATRAVVQGRTVTLDFAQGGHLSRQLNQWVPFFNAATQGAAVPARAFSENPKGWLGTVATLLVAPVVAAEAWNRADEQRARDYDDIPREVKDQGVVVMLPGEAPLDNRGERRPQFLIVKTREWTPGVLLAREIAGRAMGANPRDWRELAAAGGLSLSPVQGNSAADALSNLMPPAAGTAFQLAQDRNIFFDSKIATKSADANASPLARAGAGALEAVGVRAKPGQIEFAIRDYLGGVGQSYSEGSKILAGEQKRSDLPQDIPVAGGLIRRFIRGDVGGNLKDVQAARLSDAARDILDESGLGDFEPAAVSYAIGDERLTRDQQTRYQLLVNATVDATIRTLADSPSWKRASVADRERALKTAVSRAKKDAEATIADELGISTKKEPGARLPAGLDPLRPSVTATRSPRPTRTPDPDAEPTPTRSRSSGPRGPSLPRLPGRP